MKKQRLWQELSFYLSPRYILGILLILTSFFSAYLVSRSSDRTITVWSATRDLAPGTVITENDVTLARVRLLDGAPQYLASNAEILGTAVLRTIGIDELIPARALSEEIDMDLVRVPISVLRDHIPVGLNSGSQVDIYGMPERASSLLADLKTQKPRLVLSNIAIEAIDARAGEIGGALVLTVLVPENLVPVLIETIASNQLLLVKRLG